MNIQYNTIHVRERRRGGGVFPILGGWIEVEKESEKKRNNIVITGLKGIAKATPEKAEGWPEENLKSNIEVKVKNVWVTGGRKPKPGIQLENKSRKK